MIIRPAGSMLQLITQPDHAALALRIMREWDSGHFPDSPRKASILSAIEHHDDGWTEVDAALIVDEPSGRLRDFIDASDEVKQDTSWRGIVDLESDPYAGALMAQHRLHVYRRHVNDESWRAFFANVTDARDRYLRTASEPSLEQLLDDYRFLRAGDLASLAFCNNWASTDGDECGYAMRLDGMRLHIVPDPFGGRSIRFEIAAREIPDRPFASRDDAVNTVAAAPTIRLTGVAGGTN